MGISFINIPIVPDVRGARWKVRALAIDGKSLVLPAILEWEQKQKADFKKIKRSLTYASQQIRCINENHVTAGEGKDLEGIYEARADHGKARVMFFYWEPQNFIVCTNPYWKGKGAGKNAQNNAFLLAARLRLVFQSSKNFDDCI